MTTGFSTLRAVLTSAALVMFGAVLTPAATEGLSPAAAPQDKQATAPSVPTPQGADGHPDLTGMWRPMRGGGGGGCGEGTVFEKDKEGRPTKILFVAPDGDFSKLDAANRACRAKLGNQPEYKPELLEKVKFMDEHVNTYDTELHCLPSGVPRLGAPAQIVSYPGHVVFLYPGSEAFINTFRVIPTDGRAHAKDADPSFMGDSVGHWEGDTLVVDVVNFTDQTWMSGDGHFHSDAMHVIERFTRDGNKLKYEATVEDPGVLAKPWVKNTLNMQLNANPDAAIEEDVPCVERDASHMVGSEHH